MMCDEREFTVGDLATEMLKLAPQGAKVRIVDPDTSLTIPKFSLSYDAATGVLWIEPCEYGDMDKRR